jgi:hypothetical protein
LKELLAKSGEKDVAMKTTRARVGENRQRDGGREEKVGESVEL